MDEVFKNLVAKARRRSDVSEEIDSGIRSLQNDPVVDPVMRRMNGKFLAPLEGSGTRSMALGGPLKPIGRVDQIRRQFDVVKVDESSLNKPGDAPAVRGFLLTGTGSMFLKSNARKVGEELGASKPIKIDMKRPVLERSISSSSPNMKGILRDSSLTDVRTKPVDISFDTDDKKRSVRFNLMDNPAVSTFQRPSSALNKNLNLASESSEENEDDFEEEESEDENQDEEWDFSATPVREIKVAPSTNKKGDLQSSLEPDLKQNLDQKAPQLIATKQSEVEDGKQVKHGWFKQEMSNQTSNSKQEIEEQNEVNVFEKEVVKANKQELDKIVDEEQRRFKQNLEQAVRKIRGENKIKLEQILMVEETSFQKLLEAKREELDDRQQKELAESEAEVDNRIKASRFEIEENYKKLLDQYREELQGEFEEKRKEISAHHKSVVEVLQTNHNEILQDLERDLKLEEELIKKDHDKGLAQLKIKLAHEMDVERQKMKESGEDYEKIRCEKRLLEDKYRCLKEKYVRLKTDVKLSLEKRNNRKKEQQQVINSSETEKSNSNKTHNNEPNSCLSDLAKKRDMTKEKRLTVGEKYLKTIAAGQNYDDTTSISQSDNTVSNRLNFSEGLFPADNGNSDSEALFVKSQDYYKADDLQLSSLKPNLKGAAPPGRQRKKVFTRTKSASTSRLNSTKNCEASRPCTPVENLRRQLQKLEELEDQFPENTLDATYHLRYPFSDVVINYGNSSSELEFFKHRIHLERDSVRRAKENLKTQRTNFRTRQRDIKQASRKNNTFDQVIGEDKELTEMEVNLHRTRALLGEKVIRLRHLESSLRRVCDNKNPTAREDPTTLSDLSSSSGFSSTDFASDANHLNNNKKVPKDTDILQNLETLNAEIREIWNILNRQPSNLSSFYPSEMDWSFNVTSSNNLPLTQNPVSFMENYRQAANRNFSTLVSQSPLAGHYTSTLVERTRDLRNWLRQAKQEHERMTQNQSNII